MGCHTWFAQKVERTKEEAKKYALDWCDIAIALSEYDEDAEELGGTKEYYEKEQARFRRIKSFIEKDLFKIDTLMRMQEGLGNEHKLHYYIPNKGLYIDNDVAHDIIRVNNYPEDEFFDYNSMLKWLKKKSNQKEYSYSYIEMKNKGQINKLKEYWEQYPDSYVHFG